MPSGGCLCGRVRYAISGLLQHISHCHCAQCRKQHGAAFATYATLRAARLQIVSGDDELARYASSEWVRREFCRTCGSSLFWSDMRHPDVVAVALGTLDDDPGGRPRAHIHVASKASWYTIEDHLPQFVSGHADA